MSFMLFSSCVCPFFGLLMFVSSVSLVGCTSWSYTRGNAKSKTAQACHESSERRCMAHGITSSASLLVTSALLVVTRSY